MGPGFDPWFGKIPWRRERLPTPVFWPREFHGLYNPWDLKELDMTERDFHSLIRLSFSHKLIDNLNYLNRPKISGLNAMADLFAFFSAMLINSHGWKVHSEEHTEGEKNKCPSDPLEALPIRALLCEKSLTSEIDKTENIHVFAKGV